MKEKKYNMKNILKLIILFLANYAIGQTNVSGGIFSNTTWSVSGSPYIVTGDIAVFPGYSLSIEPGVIIKFNTSTKLIIRGSILCNGIQTNKIIFTSNTKNPKAGSWLGIEIENVQGGKIIGSHILGEYAHTFIKILDSSNGQAVNLNHTEIKNCNYAFYGKHNHSNHTVVLNNLNVHHNNYGYIYAQNVALTNSIFSNGENGIHGWENIPNISISNCEFFNFSIWPFNIEGKIDNCYIHNNAVGIKMKPALVVTNSIIQSSIIGVVSDYPFQIPGSNIYDNTICNNTQYNFKHSYSYPINVSNNCWCSSNTNDISKTIYDGYDNVSLGIATFTPLNSNCSLNTLEYTFEQNFYPNPTRDQVVFKDESDKNYTVYDMNGIIAMQGIVGKVLDVSHIPIGIYIIKISKLNQSQYSFNKLIKN